VELSENLCEGLIPVRDLGDDYYELDERNYRLVGSRTGQTYRLGDSVVVKIARTDLQRRQLDLVIAGHDTNTQYIPYEKPRKRDHKRKSNSRRK
jgi:ribonuclease R